MVTNREILEPLNKLHRDFNEISSSMSDYLSGIEIDTDTLLLNWYMIKTLSKIMDERKRELDHILIELENMMEHEEIEKKVHDLPYGLQIRVQGPSDSYENYNYAYSVAFSGKAMTREIEFFKGFKDGK